MRQTLSTVLRLAGLTIGLAAGGIFLALMWPDMMDDLSGAKSLRHFVGTFVMAIVLAWLINWPFAGLPTGWIRRAPPKKCNAIDCKMQPRQRP